MKSFRGAVLNCSVWLDRTLNFCSLLGRLLFQKSKYQGWVKTRQTTASALLARTVTRVLCLKITILSRFFPLLNGTMKYILYCPSTLKVLAWLPARRCSSFLFACPPSSHPPWPPSLLPFSGTPRRLTLSLLCPCPTLSLLSAATWKSWAQLSLT